MKKLPGLLPFFGWSLLLLAGSCASGPRDPWSSYERVDTLADPLTQWIYYRNPESGLPEGPYKKTDPEGNLLEAGFYQAGKLHGERILFTEEGDTLSVETLVNGQYDGPYRSYWQDGNLELSGQYVDNEMKGKWKRYYPDGQLMEIVTFERNLENGPFIEYHPNGNLKAEGQYLDGDNEHGELRLYDEEGALIRIMDCKHGRCRTTWSEKM